jgi:hypothetical protein
VGRPRHSPPPPNAPALGDQVTALVTERAQLVVRMAAIDKTLAGVRAALGVGTPPPASLRTVSVPPRINREVRELAHPNRDQARTEAILAQLEDGALSVREIAAALHQERLVVKQALQRLAKAGVLAKIGVGPGTKYTCAPIAPPEPTPRAVAASPVSLRAHDVSKTDLASVDARDHAILKFLRLHVATEDQIRVALHDTTLGAAEYEAACQASLTRLSVKGLITRHGKTWTATPRAVHG